MAKANIQTALAMLDPDRCAEAYELPNIMAREAFRLEQERVANFEAMLEICVRYYEHHFRRVMAGAQPPPREFVQGFVWDILEHHYQGGAEAAYRAATHGTSGGLAGVLDAIRDKFLQDQETLYFDHTILEAVDVMDWDDIKTLMQQYLQRYGRHLDGNNLPSAELLAPKYRELIRSHAQIVRNIRSHYGR